MFKWTINLLIIQISIPNVEMLINFLLTLILGSVNEVHIAISSRVLMSGYRFLVKRASNSCNCCEVKWVLCLLWRLSLIVFLLLLLEQFLDLISLVSSSWLSGLSGLWLGSRDPGSETKTSNFHEWTHQCSIDKQYSECFVRRRILRWKKRNIRKHVWRLVLMYGKVIKSWRGLKSSRSFGKPASGLKTMFHFFKLHSSQKRCTVRNFSA